MGDYISRNFSWSEFEDSDTAKRKGIDNTIPASVRPNIEALVTKVLQPVRNGWGRAMKVNSGYRCQVLNALVGGVPTSQHCKGEAADIACDNPYEFAIYIKTCGVPFDQIGINNRYIHISHKRTGTNRGQIFYYQEYTGNRL